MKSLPLRLALAALALAAVLAGCSGDKDADASSGPPTATKVGHVFIIVLENENADTTFGPGSPAPYLSQTLPAMGLFLPNYYGTGHLSLDNYVAMVSGQSPNPDTQSDCQYYTDFVVTNPTQTAPDDDGQVTGRGCVYPAFIRTIGDQLRDAGLNWREYAEDMGKDLDRDGSATCGHPPLNTLPALPAHDGTQSASDTDQYATRHNPFMYFHSVIDDQAYCDEHVVELSLLSQDLASAATTAHYNFITPDLCNDGHDMPCADGGPGGLVQADAFLQQWVPAIVNSPAFKQDGLLIITFDEAEFDQDNPTGSDFSACCNEPTGPNTTTPGITGAGGGRVGAVLISRFIRPGSTSNTSFNHYSMLKSIEDIFSLPYLGYAGQDGLVPFGDNLYSNVN